MYGKPEGRWSHDQREFPAPGGMQAPCEPGRQLKCRPRASEVAQLHTPQQAQALHISSGGFCMGHQHACRGARAQAAGGCAMRPPTRLATAAAGAWGLLARCPAWERPH